MSDLYSKGDYRSYLSQKRLLLSSRRRRIASQKAYQELIELSRPFPWILSYASFGHELDIWRLNQELASQGKLILPKVEHQILRLFRVSDLKDLLLSRWGILEPDPAKCQEISSAEISLALIPGLGFDPLTGHRLGYGKGYYDRLLKQFSVRDYCIGIGFKEQKLSPLPFNENDEPLARHAFF